MASAHFIAGRDDEALAWAEKSAQRNPFFAAAAWIAAAGAANLGRADEAVKYVARLGQLAVRVSTVQGRVSLRRPQDRTRLLDGLRKAGLPE